VNGVALVSRYARVYLRWWWFLLLIAVTAGVVAFTLSGNQVRYQATTTLVVGQSLQEGSPNQDELEASHLLAVTYADLALRQPVLQRVAMELGLGDDWQELQDRVEATAVIDTPLLELTASAESSEEAQEIADEVARQLIDIQDRVTSPGGEDLERQRFVMDRLLLLEGKIDTAEARVTQLQSTLSGPLPGGTREQLTAELQSLEGLIANWQENYASLVAVAEDQAAPRQLTILTPAQPDLTPERPRKLASAAIAIFVGLLFGLGFLTVWERSRDPLMSEDDVSKELELPLLGAVRTIRGRNPQDRLLTRGRSYLPVADDYRIIRSNIQFASNSQPVKSILVTNPPGGQGKTTTVANLGSVMAGAGLKTILIDGDLRRPKLHALFGLPRGPGLGDFLRSGSVEVEEIERAAPIQNVKVITSGAPLDNPSDWLDSPRMTELLSSLMARADIVIVDSPPTLAVVDAVALAKQVDGVVLVIDAGRTSREAARHSLSALEYTGARILGAVLNRAPDRGTYDYVSTDQPAEPGLDGPLPGKAVPPDLGASPTDREGLHPGGGRAGGNDPSAGPGERSAS
jgi:capsular exopolysaccharide synthesis family protein